MKKLVLVGLLAMTGCASVSQRCLTEMRENNVPENLQAQYLNTCVDGHLARQKAWKDAFNQPQTTTTCRPDGIGNYRCN